jgi:ComF family protein
MGLWSRSRQVSTEMTWKGLQQAIRRLDALVFPPCCRLCGATSGIDDRLCGGCLADLPWLVGGCPRCAGALPDERAAALCGACLKKLPAFDAATAPLRYRAPVDYMIQRLKFSGELALAPLLARRLAKKVVERSNPLPELLIPVPLHPARLRERGFNQATELARHVGRWLDVPVDHRLCVRMRHTPPQSLTPPAVRRRNLRGAFRLEGQLPVRHLAIIDDVMTMTPFSYNDLFCLRNIGLRTFR